MKFWITKYALTKRGIFLEGGTFHQHLTNTLMGEHEVYGGRDWHRSRQEAINRAKYMRDKKVLSLIDQIAKLEALDFDKDTPT